ncbi:MAG: polyprenyl synthetase family protein [Chloroflexota bacterium]
MSSNELDLSELVFRSLQAAVDAVPADGTLRETVQWFVSRDWAGKQKTWPFASLPLLAGQAAGDQINQATVGVAAAWNLFHLAAHILDDVEDGDVLNGPAGPLAAPEAINVATTLIFLAQYTFESQAEGAAGQLRPPLYQMLLQMCAGQHRDLTGPAADLETYWQIVQCKSGHFFGWACEAGAILAGGDAVQVERSRAYGYHLGVLLQISDDLEGFIAAGERSDLAAAKYTLPTLYALSVLSPGQPALLPVLLAEAGQNRTAEDAARAEIVRLGGLHYALVQAEIYRWQAAAAVSALPDSPARQQLLALLETAFPIQ